MKKRLFGAVLLALCAVTTAMAGDQTLTDQVRNFEHARKVEHAFIEAMIDPPGSFAITYLGRDVASQCPLNPSHELTITLRPDIDGTYINDGCTHEGAVPCFCDIYVRTVDTKRAWQDSLEPYRHEHMVTLQIDPSPSARIESSGISYSAGIYPLRADFVALELGRVAEVKRWDEFAVALDASVPLHAESPCGDPNGRACQLTTELWQVLPDGKRVILRSEFALGEIPKVWVKAGERTRVELRARFPYPESYYPIPKGKAVLVGKWFLWKYRWSLADYQVPVGTFEIPLDIK